MNRILPLVLLALAASSTVAAQGGSCDISADKPTLNTTDRLITGVGRRECSGPVNAVSSVSVTVRLRRHNAFWFDKTLASVTQTGKGVTLTAKYACKGTGSQVVFTEIIVPNGKAKSANVGVSLCG
jgi:hypothetical protein